MTEDPYEILGVPCDADEAAIRAAYIAGAKRLHPDVVGEAESGERMRALNLAYEVLKDPALRAIYDVESRGGAMPDDLESAVRIWEEQFGESGLAQDKIAALNKETVRMEQEGWKVERLHDHLVCTKTERKGLFSRPRKRRVTVSIDKHGLPFHVEQIRPD
jgi:curved DNA-binding protein CbpA